MLLMQMRRLTLGEGSIFFNMTLRPDKDRRVYGYI
jgi:hypothetical protein